MRESLLSSNDIQYALEYEPIVVNNIDNDNHSKMTTNQMEESNKNNNGVDDDNNDCCSDNDDNDSDEDDNDDYYKDYCTSIRSSTGLEIGCIVTYPDCPLSTITLSTCFEMNHHTNKTNNSRSSPNNEDHDNDNTENEEIIDSTIITPLPLMIAPIFNGTQWAGTRVWNAAIVATQYVLHVSQVRIQPPPAQPVQQPPLESLSQLSMDDTTNLSASSALPLFTLNEQTRILELGCGLGVPGMILHAMANCIVVLTDLEDLQDQMDRNIQTNFYPHSNNEQPEQRRIQAHSLDWSKEGVQHLLEQTKDLLSSSSSSNNDHTVTNTCYNYDIVFNCDCIFEPLYGRSYIQLFNCQIELLRCNPNTMMLTIVERRNLDGIEKYIQLVLDTPTIIIATTTISATEPTMIPYKVTIQQIQIPFDHPPEIEIYRLQLTRE